MIQHFSFTFFPFFASAIQLFSTLVRHQTSATKLRYLQNSAFYGEPLVVKVIWLRISSLFYRHIVIGIMNAKFWMWN